MVIAQDRSAYPRSLPLWERRQIFFLAKNKNPQKGAEVVIKKNAS